MKDTTKAIPAFMPIDLSAQNMTIFASIATAIDSTVTDVAEGFMRATPQARDAASMLWKARLDEAARQEAANSTAPNAEARITAQAASALVQNGHLRALKRLIGLAPDFELDLLVQAGLRYPDPANDASAVANVA